MGNYDPCCDPCRPCEPCDRCEPCNHCDPCCDDNSNGIWLLILLIVIYLIFCNDNKGGLFGGLF